jgi:hypothetical protein
MRIPRRYGLLLGILIGLSGCSPTRLSTPDSLRPLGPIPTPQDAPAEPTFKPDVLPRFMRDDRPLHPRPRPGMVERWLPAEPPRESRPAPEGDR